MSSFKAWRALALVVAVGLAAGLMEERLLKTVWGPKGRRFRQAWLMVALSFLSTAALSFLSVLRSPSPSLRPAVPLYRYLLPGALLAASVTCAHRALMHVSYTTISLAPQTEIFFASLFLHLVLEKEWSTRRWTSAWVIFVASFVYLFALDVPKPGEGDTGPNQVEVEEWGFGYLVISRALLGLSDWSRRRLCAGEEGVRDLAWVRLGGGVVAGLVVLHQWSGPVKMDLLTTPYFTPEWPKWDLILYALLSGLAALLYTQATSSAGSSYAHPSAQEALVPEALLKPGMALAGIIVNAVFFRRVGKITATAWTGVGWVFGGVWIKEDPRFDDSDENAPKGATLGKFDAQGKYVRVGAKAGKEDSDPESGSQVEGNIFWRQYAPALLLPPLLVIFLRGLLLSGAEVKHVPATGTFVNGSNGLVLLEGGNWELEFHQAITPVCLDGNDTKRWEGKRRTVLASHERSGNTWTRELVERSTGWQSSTISYCDKALLKTFKGECDHDANFLVKSHFPRIPADDSVPWRDYTSGHHIDQAIHLIRNPIDSIYSEWQLAHYPKKNGEMDHSGRLEIGRLGAGRNAKEQRAEVLRYARNWARHEDFWAHKAEIPTHRVRYEDIMRYKLPSLMGMLSFLLPPDELPSLSNVACITEQDAAREAYKSRKSPQFAAWDKWESRLRTEVIIAARVGWCRWGYDKLLRETLGEEVATGVEDLCK